MARYRNRAPTVRNVARKFERINRKGSERAKEIMDWVNERIKETAPYDPNHDEREGPHMRDSFHVRADPERPDAWVLTTANRYWVFVEYGTKDHGDAQHFIRNALDAAKVEFG